MKQSSASKTAEHLVLNLLRQALGTHGSVDAIRRSGRETRVDIVLRLGDGPELYMDLKTADIPRKPLRSDAIQLLVLRRATRRLHDELRRAGVSFVDTAGMVHLSLPNVLVDRANLRVPTRGTAVRRHFDPFSDRGSLILRTLMEPGADRRVWGVRELAAAAGASPATATRVLRELETAGLEVVRSGRTARVRLVDSMALFGAWTRAYDWTRNASVAFNAPMGDVTRFLTRMSRAWSGPRWALTLQAGAARLAPLATWNRAHVYVDVPDVSALMGVGQAQGWEPAEGGNVVLLKPWYRTSAWHGIREISGVPVVSPLQLALDLWHYPLRGREQAEHLMETMLSGRSL
ncbi:type IV toxin-antitoxin system AbiEi family antitoxin [Longimicrobium sp.]|uniref:type IV toxin-antitoxin system AbiEi family antitoxin n=1 Tax=Longimicrobium sp. TaxID=2029185 RepID=UPI003B3AEF7D